MWVPVLVTLSLAVQVLTQAQVEGPPAITQPDYTIYNTK